MTNHPNRSQIRPTADQVRALYEAQGKEVRIDVEGHVEFRHSDDGKWLEGRWVSEYRLIDGAVALV